MCDRILYKGGPKGSQKTHRIELFSQVAGCKIHIQKSVAFLYNNGNHTKKDIRKIILFRTASNNKYLEISPTQEEKDLYNESFKHWRKKLKKSPLDEKISPAHGSVGLML